MDIFKQTKDRVKILDVCNLLGIKLNKNYKCLCPFPNHKEKTPSFSISTSKNIFYCFGCNKKGDSISLVSELLGISPFEAAKYLNDMLHLEIDIKGKREDKNKINLYIQQRESKKRFDEWENQTFQFLCDCYKKILEWKKTKEPEKDEYIYALKNIDYLGYIIDEIFIYGTDEDKIWFKKNLGKKVDEWKQMISAQKI